MSRKIKFRVWDANKKCFPAEGAIYLIDAIKGYRKNLIAEQYTGFKDKNGKEICEGDIFRNTINGGTWRVYWNEKDAAFWVDSGVAGCSLGEFNWDRSNRKYGFIRKNCEIIGNIHENPELLGGKE